jgi:hypothetical protein
MTYDNADRDQLVRELIQVAAVTLTWVEALEGNHGGPQPAADGPVPGAADRDRPLHPRHDP